MFNIGNGGSQSDNNRINNVVITPYTIPPSVSFLWKTHKHYTDLLPTRPVCDATNGPIAKVSNLWTTVIRPLLNRRKYPKKCYATENMLAAIQRTN